MEGQKIVDRSRPAEPWRSVTCPRRPRARRYAVHVGRPPLPPPPLLDPAWYPDPTGRYEARYWDGRTWTSHISHYGATGADPLLRARFDRWWIRGTLRIAMWGAVVLAGIWAFNEYWPTDERDLAADEQLATAAVLSLSDLPDAGWSPATARLVSPLSLTVDEEGRVPVLACETLAGNVSNGADEPRRVVSFGSSNGLSSIAHATTVGNGTGFGRSYLDALRTPEAGACLTALWEATASGDLTVTSTTEMTALFGDETVWWRLTADDTSGPFSVETFADIVVVRVDAVVTEYVFGGSVASVGVDVQRDVIQLELARLRELLAARSAAENAADAGDEDTEGEDDSGADSVDSSDDGTTDGQ